MAFKYLLWESPELMQTWAITFAPVPQPIPLCVCVGSVSMFVIDLGSTDYSFALCQVLSFLQNRQVQIWIKLYTGQNVESKMNAYTLLGPGMRPADSLLPLS